jgi:hypothetical protein
MRIIITFSVALTTRSRICAETISSSFGEKIKEFSWIVFNNTSRFNAVIIVSKVTSTVGNTSWNSGMTISLEAY